HRVKTRERIRSDQIHVLDSRKRVVQVRFQGNEQAVVSGAANRHVHFVLTDVRVNAWECASRARSPAGSIETGVESVAGEVGDFCAGGNSAIDGGGIETGAAAEAGVGGRNRSLGVSDVQEPDVTHLVCVDTEQVVEANVADEVHAKHGAVAK